ncbi:MAG: NUDIX domain-containing protein [Microgenomates group bacterium]
MSNKILNNVRLIQKCIIVGKDGKVLVLKRAADDQSRGGNWDLPGGGYEQGEEVIAAIKREVMEEVGLTVSTLSPVYFTNRIGVGEGFFKGDTVFGACYMSTDWTGDLVLSSEHVEYKWASPQEFKAYNFGADSGFFVEAIVAYLHSLNTAR